MKLGDVRLSDELCPTDIKGKWLIFVSLMNFSSRGTPPLAVIFISLLF